MCFSAMVWQAYEEYIRTMGAPPDYAQIEELLTRRLTDKSIRFARGFERNFDSPKTPEERRIKDLIDQHRAVYDHKGGARSIRTEEAPCRCAAKAKSQRDKDGDGRSADRINEDRSISRTIVLTEGNTAAR
jgi:hypothetical protein